MKRVLSILRGVLFVLMAVSVILPRVESISFCHPMDQIMLRACCHPDTPPDLEEGADSIHRPSCCDEIAVPTTDSETLTSVVLPLVHYVPAYPSVPLLSWGDVQQGIPNIPPVRARGPPPDPLPLFIQHCSYRI